MHAHRRQKLTKFLLPVFILALVLGLALYALRQNISLFYTPTEVASGKPPKGANIRMGGRVVSGSIKRGEDLAVQFDLTDLNQTVHVYYKGLLPDLFREEQGLVVEGMPLENGAFNARVVLAKHDENYMPPEVKDALERGQAVKERVTS